MTNNPCNMVENPFLINALDSSSHETEFTPEYLDMLETPTGRLTILSRIMIHLNNTGIRNKASIFREDYTGRNPLLDPIFEHDGLLPASLEEGADQREYWLQYNRLSKMVLNPYLHIERSPEQEDFIDKIKETLVTILLEMEYDYNHAEVEVSDLLLHYKIVSMFARFSIDRLENHIDDDDDEQRFYSLFYCASMKINMIQSLLMEKIGGKIQERSLHHNS